MHSAKTSREKENNSTRTITPTQTILMQANAYFMGQLSPDITGKIG